MFPFPRLVVLLIVVLASRALATEPEIRMYWQICELTGDVSPPKSTVHLEERRGAELISPPPTVVRSGKLVEASVARDFDGAHPSSTQVGVFLKIRPKVAGHRFEYSVDAKRVEYLGRREGKRDAFDIRKRTGIKGVASAGKSVVLDLGLREEKHLMDGFNGRKREVVVKRRLLAILTFTRA